MQEWILSLNGGEFWVCTIFQLHVSADVFTASTVKRICSFFSADVLYDLGTGLELVSPLCPHLFLEMAGLGNFAKVIYMLLRTSVSAFLSSFNRRLMRYISFLKTIF